MTDSRPLRALDGGEERARAERDRANAYGYAARAMEEVIQSEHGSGGARQRQVHRDIAAVMARLSSVYAERDLARSMRELARAMEAVAAEHRARREAGR